MGGIFRNSSSDWVLGYMGSLSHTTNTQAELIVLLQGLQIAEQRGLTSLEINTDLTEVIRVLNLGNQVFDSIISECRSIILRLRGTVVKHNYREKNRVNKDLFGRTTILTVPLVFANESFWADILGTVFARKITDRNIKCVRIFLHDIIFFFN